MSVPPYHIASVSSVLSRPTPAAAWCSSSASTRRPGWQPSGPSRSPTRWSSRRCSAASSTSSRRTAPGCPRCARSPTAAGRMPRAGGRAGHGSCSTDVDFVNAYGLTETSSTIAVLGPEDHRDGVRQRRPRGARRGSARSAGRCPASRCRSATPTGAVLGRRRGRRDLGARRAGVRGVPRTRRHVDDGWFNTRDAGRVDGDGYLFVHGRLDDVIVRGGENLSPGRDRGRAARAPRRRGGGRRRHPRRRVGRAGGRRGGARTAGAEATEDELRGHVRSRLRSARTPERIQVTDELPFSETGKLLRRVLRDELDSAFGAEGAPT